MQCVETMESDDREGASEGRGQYYNYPKDKVAEAVENIRNNEMSFGEASRFYGIPKTTLYNKSQNKYNSRRGATTTLTKAQEDELAEWILKHQEYGDPRTKQDMINTACEIAQLDDDSSNHFKNGLPTSGWVEGFLKRYPHVVFRKPEAISKAAAVNTKEDFSKLWRNIYDFLEKTNQLDLLHKPEHWWNADETSFPMDPIPKRVLARKGCKNVHRRERGSPKSNTTFTYAFSAAGDYIEPLITLKDSASNIADIAYACGSVGANFGINQTDSGWAQEDSFYHYVATHLHKQWESKGSPKPRILIIDGYRAHLSVRLLRWGKLNDCIIIVLYPNGTPYLQMCDTTMFKPMKEKHTELYQQWRLKNPIGNSDNVVLVKLVKMVNDAVIKKESIINGWRATGLQPFNFNNLKCDDLLCKSPDFVYDFKGHHIVSQSTENSVTAGCTEDLTMIMEQTVGAISAQSFNNDNNIYIHRPDWPGKDNSITLYSEDGEHSSTLYELELPVTRIDNFQQSNMNYIGTEFVATNEVTEHLEINEVTDHMETNEVRDHTETNQVTDHMETNEVTDHMDLTESTPSFGQSDIQEPKQTDVAANFSELNSRDKIFRSNVDASFVMSDFGISNNLLSRNSESKLSKLTTKIRRDVRELALLCAANDKTKLVNILIVNQQLDVIDPPDLPLEKVAGTSNEARTIQSILVPPTMPQRVKDKTHRNIKVGYGVATADEVLEHLAEREILDGQLEIEQEENEIEKKVRERKMDDLEKQLQETRKLLMVLRSENSANVKEAAQQKKSKKRKGGNESLLDDIIIKNKREIEVKNEELKVLREQLKNLKADHVLANKAAAAKRRNDIQMKKERGNVIIPLHASDTPN